MKENTIKPFHPPGSNSLQTIRKAVPDQNMLYDMAQIFNMLADPTRLKIVIALKTSELCVHEISQVVKLSISAVSHQLRLLKATKLVRGRREGKHIYYVLDDEHIEKLLETAAVHAKEK